MGALRHTCLGCGGSCHGVVVRVTSKEAERLSELAEALGVEEPVVDGTLRRENGHCVFLDPSGRCAVHARFGPAAKPRLCNQYPLVLVEADEGLRVGLDPGCYTAFRTWQTGDEHAAEDLLVSPAPLAPEQVRAEQALLALAIEGTVEGMLARIAAPGVVERWRARLGEVELEPLLMRPETGVVVRNTLLPVLQEARALKEMPGQPLPPELDAWAMEVTRRMLWLRLGRQIPSVQAVALLTLLGAVTCGWHTTEPDAFTRALAAWVRALRAPLFWGTLLPDPSALARLVVGTRPERGSRGSPDA